MVTGVTTPNMMQSNIIGTSGAMPQQHKEAAIAMPVKSDRRSNKPIMEKRRRARINNCLNELKTLILDATKKDPARHSKLEKADILEKTVKHLQELQRQQAAMQQATDPKVLNKFKAGFADCANEVSRFPGLDPVTKRRLLQHLSNCLNGVKTELHQHQRQNAHTSIHTQILPSPPSSPEQQDNHHHHSATSAISVIGTNATATATATATANPNQNPNPNPYTVQQTPNGYFLPNGLQVIPTKLPNGSIALVLPHNLPQQSVSPHHPQVQQHQQQQLYANSQQQQQQAQTLLAAKLQQHPMLVPIPLRTASTSSASSHASSTCGYEYNPISSNTLTVPSSSYTPPSPANSHEAMEYKPALIQYAASSAAYLNLNLNVNLNTTVDGGNTDQDQDQNQDQQQHHAQPLSLVVRKDIIKEEEQPWRPW